MFLEGFQFLCHFRFWYSNQRTANTNTTFLYFLHVQEDEGPCQIMNDLTIACSNFKFRVQSSLRV